MPTSTGTYDTSTISYDQSSLSYDGFPAPLSGMPAVGVFVAWTGTPYEVNPTGGWTEISQYVRQITIRRGRQDDLQQFPPGAAQLVLDNRDRLFDPFNDGRLATRTNLVPNPSFEVDTSNCEVTSPAGSTIATTTSVALFGSSSLAGTTAATTGNLIFGTSTVTRIAVTPSLQYTASGYIRSAAVSRTGYIRILFYNAAGSIVQTTNAANITTSTTIWTRSNVTVTAPATAVTAVIQCVVLSVGATETHYVDGLQFEQASAVGTYFDGSSTDGSWTGVPNNSTSQLKVYRRNLVTNPSFETNLAGWSLTGTTTRVATQQLFGTASAEMVYAGSGTVLINNTTAIPVSAGVAYTYSFYCKQSVDAGSVVSNILWFNSAGVQVSDDLHQSNNPSTAWQRFSQTRTAPANATSMVLRIYQTAGEGGGAVATNNYIDGVLVEQSSSVGDYFDGSLAGAFNFGTPQWEGTANASTSVMRKFPLPSQLSPRDQIKIVANWNGVEYPLYRGYVAGWPVEYADGGTDSTVTIDCFDLLGLIGASTINRNFYDDYLLSLGPKRYYPLSERPDNNQFFDRVSGTAYIYETGRTVISPSGGGVLPWTTSTIRQGAPMLPGLETPSIFSTFDSATLRDIDYSPSASGTAQDCSMTFVAQLNERSYLFNFSFGNFLIQVDSSRRVTASTSSGTYIVCTSPTIDDNKPHHFVFTFNNSTDTLRCFVDGKQTSVVTTAGAGMWVWPLTSSLWEWYGLTQIQNVATFERELSSTEVQILYQASIAQFAQNTSERITDYLGYTNLPSGMYEVSADVQTQVLQLEPEASPVLPEFAKLMAGEDGNLYVDRLGVLQFTGRQSVFSRTRSNTSQVTFTDTGVGVEYDAGAVRLQFDAEQVRNRVTVRSSENAEATATDSDSVNATGQAAENRDTYLLDSSAAQTLANYLVTVYKNPKMTLEPFMSKGQQDPTYNWPRLLGLELLDRVTFKRTPATGSAIVKDLLVQSIEHRITPGEWQTVVNGSARYTNWFILGVSRLGSDDLLLN